MSGRHWPKELTTSDAWEPPSHHWCRTCTRPAHDTTNWRTVGAHDEVDVCCLATAQALPGGTGARHVDHLNRVCIDHYGTGQFLPLFHRNSRLHRRLHPGALSSANKEWSGS